LYKVLEKVSDVVLVLDTGKDGKEEEGLV